MEPFNIEQLLAEKAIETYFQPIASIRRHGAIGFEALSRGCVGGAIVPPLDLFAAAEAGDKVRELDLLCLQRALQTFVTFAPTPNAILFVNCRIETVGRPEAASELAQFVRTAGLEPRRVVIEILETAFADTEAARLAVERLREQEFLLALDDIGAGHSNLDRIAVVKPDILKADRSLTQGMDTDYHKREVFKSLVSLSEKIGGWIIAEGIETQEEAVTVLDLGGDLMQGYYFARPVPEMPEQPPVRIAEMAREFKRHTLAKVHTNRQRYDERIEALHALKAALQALNHPATNEVEACLQRVVNARPEIESVCLLDENGVQLTQTILNAVRFDPNKSLIFAPPERGTDHSFKEYFYLLSEAHLNPFVSQPYVPLPTNDLCVTMSTLVPTANDKTLVLVTHFHASFGQEMQITTP